MFEKVKEQAPSVSNMLSRLEARVNSKRLDQSEAEKAFGVVAEAITEAKKTYDKIDFSRIDKIDSLTNAWNAWNTKAEKGGIFTSPEHAALSKKLQPLLEQNRTARYARQIWRSEMVAYVADKLKTSKNPNASRIMESVMGAQKVPETENNPTEALRTAVYLDRRILSRSVREGLAAEMKASTKSGTAYDISQTLFPNVKISKIKVVVGGDLFEVPDGLEKDFRFKNMVMDKKEDRIYAQMENGCRGNLVIIELKTPGPLPEGRGPSRTPGPLPEGRGPGRTPGPLPEGRGPGRTPGPLPEGRGPSRTPGPLPEGRGPSGTPGPLPEGRGPSGTPGPLPEGGGPALEPPPPPPRLPGHEDYKQ